MIIIMSQARVTILLVPEWLNHQSVFPMVWWAKEALTRACSAQPSREKMESTDVFHIKGDNG